MHKNLLEANQDRSNRVCEAIKTLNTQETRYVFVDYITPDERKIINDMPSKERKDVLNHPFTEAISLQLQKDIASCFNIDKEKFSVSFGRGWYSSYDNNDNLDNKSPSFEDVMSNAQMHQDLVSKGGDAVHVAGINAALAIIGPSTIFAEYNEHLYPSLTGFKRDAISNIVQADENQVAIFTQGRSGAVHGFPFRNYEHRAMVFVLSQNEQVIEQILGELSAKIDEL
jgi:hypothetical protein